VNQESKQLTIAAHPLLRHKLTRLRRRETKTSEFRALIHEVALLLGYAALENLPLEKKAINTPVGKGTGWRIAQPEPCFFSILRSGEAMLQAFMQLIPSAHVGHIGTRRNEETLKPEQYYFKAPAHMENGACIVLDPMLATGGTAVEAVDILKANGAKDIRFVSIVCAPAGVQRFHQRHPDVPLLTASLDEGLSDDGFIVPGMGDVGDRYFGTLPE